MPTPTGVPVAITSPGYKVMQVIQNAGSPVQYLDSPEFEKYVQADAKRMTDVVKKIGKVE